MKYNKNQKKSSSTHEAKRIALFTGVLLLAIGAVFFFVLRSATSATAGSLPIISADGFQEVHMAVNGLDYEPSTLTVKAGQKVRWIIDATNAQGCSRAILSPQLNINQPLKKGANVFEFTPSQPGIIKFSCPMGMSRGQFQVV